LHNWVWPKGGSNQQSSARKNVSCKEVICEAQRVGCSWRGPRRVQNTHTSSCPYTKLTKYLLEMQQHDAQQKQQIQELQEDIQQLQLQKEQEIHQLQQLKQHDILQLQQQQLQEIQQLQQQHHEEIQQKEREIQQLQEQNQQETTQQQKKKENEMKQLHQQQRELQRHINCGTCVGSDSYFCSGTCGLGPVCGTDIYTNASHKCTAAKHAGVIPHEGGWFRVINVAERHGPFESTARNGVTTRFIAKTILNYKCFTVEKIN